MYSSRLPRPRSEFGDVVATSQSLEVEDAQAFEDSVAAIRRHMDDGTSDELLFEVRRGRRRWERKRRGGGDGRTHFLLALVI